MYIQDVDGGISQPVPMPNGYQYLTQPSFSDNGESIYFVAGLNKTTDIYNYHIASNTLKRLTHGQEAVAHPIEMQDETLLYLSINADGPDIKSLANTNIKTTVTDLAVNSKAPLLMVNEHTLPKAKVYTQEVGEKRDYAIFDQHATFALGSQYYSASTSLLSMGIKSSDLLKQLDLQAGYSIDLNDDALHGGFVNAKYNALDVKFKLALYDYNLDTSRQYQALSPSNLNNEIDALGGFVAMSYPLKFGQLSLTPELAYNYTDYKQSHTRWTRVGFAQRWQYDRQTFAIGQRVNARWYEGKGENNWQGYDLDASIFGKVYNAPLYINFTQKQRDDATPCARRV